MRNKETKLSRFSKRYLAALRSHLGMVLNPPSLKAAHDLGTLAVVYKLETLDIATIHDQAMKALVQTDITAEAADESLVRGTHFFNEVIAPIEATHGTEIEAAAELVRLSAALVQRTLDLADAQLELQRHVNDRESSESALLSSRLTSSQLLSESQRLEKRLQLLARKIVAANETERKEMSLKLHDEIAQTLLGIHVRLLSLKKEATNSNEGLAREIATTQRLLEHSVIIINRFACELGAKHDK